MNLTNEDWTFDRKVSKMEAFYFYTLARATDHAICPLAEDLEKEWDQYPYIGHCWRAKTQITRYRDKTKVTFSYEEVIEFLKSKIRNELNETRVAASV